MPWKLVFLMQYVKLRKNGDVYFELINGDGVVVMVYVNQNGFV